MPKVKCVLSGSGLRYPVFGGALARLWEAGYEPGPICGVSGGAIIAAAVACGYQTEGSLKELVMRTLPGPNDLIDWSWLPFIRPKYAVIWGQKIQQSLEENLPGRMGETKIPLHIVAADLEMREHVIFSSGATPDVPVSIAVRASMSIPFVFDPVRHNGRLLVDGGVVANFPLDIFGDGQDVIGLRFRAGKGASRIQSRKDFAMAVLDSFIEGSTREHVEDAIFAQTILLDTEGTSLDFDLDEAGAERLWEDGRASVDAWLAESNA